MPGRETVTRDRRLPCKSLVGHRQSEGHRSLRAVEKHWNPFLFILSEAAILLPDAELPNPP